MKVGYEKHFLDITFNKSLQANANQVGTRNLQMESLELNTDIRNHKYPFFISQESKKVFLLWTYPTC